MSETPPTVTTEQPPRHENTRRDGRWWTLAAVCLGTFMLLLDVTAVNVALPAIQADLHASLAGRLSARVPARWLIGPGLILIGAGQLLMRGLDAGSAWTHLVPGLIVGGLGIGMTTPPLASTAVGVVPPQQAGMASGINNTFRQVGIATGIALLGALFSAHVNGAQVNGTASGAAFTAGLNRIMLVGAIIALTAGMISLVTIRPKDFASH